MIITSKKPREELLAMLQGVHKVAIVGCANCAAKMEEGIRKLEGVFEVSINFFAQKMIIELDEERSEDIMKQAQRVVSKVDPNCRIIIK